MTTLQPPADPTSAKRLVADARALIENLTPEQLARELQGESVVLVDLREQSEREAHGTIPGALHIPRGVLEFCADPALPYWAEELDPGRRVILFCASGSRSALAVLALKAMGFPHVAHLDGGFASWRSAAHAVVAAPAVDTANWARLLSR